MAAQKTHRVIRVKDGSEHGQHGSEALAQKRIGRLVAMSNGKLTAADWKIEPIDNRPTQV